MRGSLGIAVHTSVRAEVLVQFIIEAWNLLYGYQQSVGFMVVMGPSMNVIRGC